MENEQTLVLSLGTVFLRFSNSFWRSKCLNALRCEVKKTWKPRFFLYLILESVIGFVFKYIYIYTIILTLFIYTWLCIYLLSHVQLSAAPWTVTRQAPLSMGFSRQESWGGLPFPPPGDLLNPGNKFKKEKKRHVYSRKKLIKILKTENPVLTFLLKIRGEIFLLGLSELPFYARVMYFMVHSCVLCYLGF